LRWFVVVVVVVVVAVVLTLLSTWLSHLVVVVSHPSILLR
jgi:hypothetical protein